MVEKLGLPLMHIGTWMCMHWHLMMKESCLHQLRHLVLYNQTILANHGTLESVDLTVTSIAADSRNKEIYIAGFSSGGFQEVYKINYDSNSYELIGTNKELR